MAAQKCTKKTILIMPVFGDNTKNECLGTKWHGYHILQNNYTYTCKIGRAHVWTPVTDVSRMPSSAWKKKNQPFSTLNFQLTRLLNNPNQYNFDIRNWLT